MLNIHVLLNYNLLRYDFYVTALIEYNSYVGLFRCFVTTVNVTTPLSDISINCNA